MHMDVAGSGMRPNSKSSVPLESSVKVALGGVAGDAQCYQEDRMIWRTALTVACAAAASAAPPTSGESEVSTVTRDTLGTMSDGRAVERFTLTNDRGSMLRAISLGATATELHVRDRDGELADLLLGFDTVAEYEANPPYMGCTTGRVANRISNARFELDGVAYELARNFGEHHLHGGNIGLHQRLWSGETVAHDLGPAVRFTYLSPDGEEGYPGNLSIAVTYVLTEEDGYRLEYLATTDKATPVNLTNHSYFNLSGAGAGSIFDHVLTIHAAKATERGEQGVPTGAIVPVTGTPIDFSRPKRIGADVDKIEVHYDHNFVLDHGGGDEAALSAEVFDPASGRVMQLFTNEPGVQLYTSYYLEPTKGKGGATYDQFHGLCLETQHFPDAVNKPDFPSIVLRPGETYSQITEYRFSTR